MSAYQPALFDQPQALPKRGDIMTDPAVGVPKVADLH